MDIQLPGIDGHEATRRIKAIPALARTPIIAVTSYALAGDDRKAAEAGCDAYVTKPFSPRALLAQVTHVPRDPRPRADGSFSASPSPAQRSRAPPRRRRRSTMPMRRAAASERSAIRPRMNGPAIVDDDLDAAPVLEIRHANARAERQRPMRHRQRLRIEGLAARGAACPRTRARRARRGPRSTAEGLRHQVARRRLSGAGSGRSGGRVTCG